MKKHYSFILIFIILIIVFFKEVIVMKSSFLSGDYLVQFYPWSKLYAASIKHFEFPFWTRYFNSGFPLVAEGQVGGFYPFNLVMFFLLPFEVAYNYSIILHFVLAGVFTYMYARKIGSDQWGGTLSALTFCFGSAYAGCFYNTVTMKTLIWFPLVLFLFEKYFDRKRIQYLIFSGLIIGIQFLAGFAQMAFYSLFFYMVYFLYGLRVAQKITFEDLLKFGVVVFISIIVFYPQLILSWQLMQLSNRSNASLGFALWGSFSPLNLLGVYFPYTVIKGTTFYIGVLTIVFLINAVINVKQEIRVRPIFLIFLLSFFLALGVFNPFYVFLLKLTGLYIFRNPSKLLFFGMFSASVMAGWGFTRLCNFESHVAKNKTIRLFSVVTFIMLGVLLSLNIIFTLMKDAFLSMGKWYASHYIYGKAYHRYDISVYFDKVNDFYQQIVAHSSLNNVFTIASLLLCFSALLLVRYAVSTKETKSWLKYVSMAFITIDLYLFSFYGTGFRGNMQPYTKIAYTHQNILRILKDDKGMYRIVPFDLTDGRMPWWVRPNANILVGVESIASYTPLVESNYNNALSGLEVVDCSLGLVSPSEEAVVNKLQLLRLLNVKYIVTARDLRFDFLEKLISEDSVSLYKLKNYFPRVFFSKEVDKQMEVDSEQRLRLVKYTDGFIKIALKTDKDGYVILSERYYSGWSVYVDGKKSMLIKAHDLIQAVKVNKGDHQILFKYEPVFFGSAS